MGIENLKETIQKAEKAPARKESFAELAKKEKEVIQKVKDIFRQNAELNLLLCEGDLNLSEHQKRYFIGQLSGFRRDAKGVLQNLRKAVPAGTASGYFEKEKKRKTT